VNAPQPQVRLAKESDHEAAAECLALAFADDPAWAHLLPGEETRAERLLAYYSAEIANLVPDLRELWVTDDWGGAAIWGRPDGWRVPMRRTMREGPPMARVFGARLPLAMWTQLRFERHHPRRPAHWYLHYLGVEPRRQGRGLGGALLAPVHDLCDRDGVPAYLESSTDRSRALYERNGFSLTDTFDIPRGGPPMRKMWRDSKDSPR